MSRHHISPRLTVSHSKLSALPLRNIFLLFLTLFLALATGCAQEGTGPVSLAYDFREGDTHTYDVTFSLEGDLTGGEALGSGEAELPQTALLQARVSTEVVEVDEAGGAVVELTLESASLETDGREAPLPLQGNENLRIHLDEQGRIVSVDGQKPEGLEDMFPPGMDKPELPFDPSGSGMADWLFPEEGVAEPGDSWESTVQHVIPFLDQSVTVTSTATLASVEDRNGAQVANLEFAVDAPVDLTLDLADLMARMGEGDSELPSPDFEMPALSLTIQGEHTFAGTASLYTETGFPTSADVQATLKLTIRPAAAEDSAASELSLEPTIIDFTFGFQIEEVL